MFLRKATRFEQEAAYAADRAFACLARAASCVSVKTVVAAWDEQAGTQCLYRYPSPVGRRGLQISCPPVFFTASGKTVYRQWVADFSSGFDRGWTEPFAGPRVSFARLSERKGTEECTSGTGSWAWRPVRALRPVATRLANRPSWALAPGRQGLPSSMALSARAPWSALRPTSPIATNTRRAATERDVPAAAPDLTAKPIPAAGRGGFFVAIAGGVGPRPRPEGTRNVQ